MRGAIPPLSQYVFIAWYLVKDSVDFTIFYLYPSKCLPSMWLLSALV
jgi:hypothetical protein